MRLATKLANYSIIFFLISRERKMKACDRCMNKAAPLVHVLLNNLANLIFDVNLFYISFHKNSLGLSSKYFLLDFVQNKKVKLLFFIKFLDFHTLNNRHKFSLE